jgi:sigma-B regulation protein RsbU (phosphoserine phosphatase)
MAAEDQIAIRLRELLAVTDAGLSSLTVESLLVELLERLRGIFDADTAAVLLRDGDASYLVARAACGLEEEVRQGVRVPVGTGFAGAIAARLEPVFLDRVDETTVANPILWEKGVRSMLGVPLRGGGGVLGVVHVGRLESRSFTEHDGVLLQVAADRIAAALHARETAVDTAAARLLERGLQPTRLPDLPEVEFAARYVPAESGNVGGDWYDAFTVPSGELWVAIGDVAGHGMHAAIVMGRVRSALRSYALLGTTPEQALTLTDRKVEHFEIGSMVTLLAAASTPPYDHLRICSAGHLPPVLARRGQAPELVELPVGPPLGTKVSCRRTATSVALEPGTLALLYTDGLIERRNRSIDEGLRLLQAVTTAARPDIACRTVMHEMIGNYPAQDDIAMLALRRRPDPASALTN